MSCDTLASRPLVNLNWPSRESFTKATGWTTPWLHVLAPATAVATGTVVLCKAVHGNLNLYSHR